MSALWAWFASSCLVAAQLAQVAAGVQVREILAKQDAGVLTEAELSAALAQGGEIATQARALMLHEISPFPVQVLAAASLQQQELLLEGLAEWPRVGATPWLKSACTNAQLSRLAQLHAIIALPEAEITRHLGLQVLASIHSNDWLVRCAAERAAAKLPATVADALAEHVLACRRNERPSGDVVWPNSLRDWMAWLQRVSAEGEATMAKTYEHLDAEDRDFLLSWLRTRQSPELARILNAQLELDQVPIEVLRYCGPYLDRPSRIEKVRRLVMAAPVGGGGGSVGLAVAALVAAGAIDNELLAILIERAPKSSRGWQDLAEVPQERYDDDSCAALLSADVKGACRWLAQKPLTKALEQNLMALAMDAGATLEHRLAAARVVVRQASPDGLRELFASLEPGLQIDLIDFLPLKAPGITQFLRDLVERTPADASAFAIKLQKALARRGDRSAVDTLVRDLAQLPSEELAELAPPFPFRLESFHAPVLTEYLAPAQPHGLRLLVVRWLAERPDLIDPGALRQVMDAEESLELVHAARIGLLRTSARAAFTEQIDRAIGAGFGADAQDLAMDWLATTPQPTSALDRRLLLRLLLELPARWPSDLRWPVALTHGLVGALSEQPTFDPAELEAVQATLASSAKGTQRGALWLLLLTEIARYPRLRAELGPTLARHLLVASPPAVALGPAHLVLAEHQANTQQFELAAQSYRCALRGFLTEPPKPPVTRIFLSEPDQGGLSRLASRAHLFRSRAAQTRGDRGLARQAAVAAVDLARGDAESLRVAQDWLAQCK